MMMHSDLMLAQADYRQHELIAEAERSRLLTTARRARRARKAPGVRGQPTGTLAACEPSAVVPAR
jgi:hypothetical protein